MKVSDLYNCKKAYHFVDTFPQKVYAVYNGVWGKAPEGGEFSGIFVLIVTLNVHENTVMQS